MTSLLIPIVPSARRAEERRLPWLNGLVLAVTFALLAGLLGLRVPPAEAELGPEGSGLAGLQTIASGLVNPRGLKFGPDGALYVAEAGYGGDRLVRAGLAGLPYGIGRSSRVERIALDGGARILVRELPSVRVGDEVWGATAVAFVGQSLFVLTAAGGRDVGDAVFDNAVLRVSPDGAVERIVDLTDYNLEQPPLARRLDIRADVEGGVPFGLTAFDGRLYATDGNLETVTEVALDPSTGELRGLRRLFEYPASDHVLVGLTPGLDNGLYVAEYGPFPHSSGSGKIGRLTLDGERSDAWVGLSTVIDVAFGPDGAMYALEFSPGRRTPETGRLLRRGLGGAVEVLASGLNFPTGLAIAPNGDVYLSESGHKSDDGTGRIVRIRVSGL